MDDYQKEEIILQIISKEQKVKISDKEYILLGPSKELKLESTKVFNEAIKKYRFDDIWLSEKQCLKILVHHQLCSFDVDGNLKIMEKKMDDLKVQLFESAVDIKKNKQIRSALKSAQNKYNELTNIRHSLDHLTLKGFAEMIKRQYLIFKTLRDSDKNIIWNAVEDIDVFLFEKISAKLLENALTSTQIREIARTEPWRTYWGIKKTDVFDGSVFDFTDEQKTLVLYSKMYDSAYEHPNCPSDSVIKDDDMFDGWMIFEQREREKERKQSQVENRMHKQSRGNLNKADEIFIPAASKEEQMEIHDFNDGSSKFIKSQRRAVLDKKGQAVDSDFLDRKTQIQQMSNEQFMNTVKGKK